MNFEESPEAIRARFRWAMRQGAPKWLWPEINPVEWQAAVSEIERATRQILTVSPGPALLSGDPAAVGIAAYTSGMGPLLGYWIKLGILQADREILSLLEAHFEHNSVRMNRMEEHARVVVDSLSRAGMNVIVLKGMHTAYSYFPVPGTRPLSDIDLLVSQADEGAASAVLRSLGYSSGPRLFGEQEWRLDGAPTEPNSLSLVHKDGPWSIDLHWSLDRKYSPGSQVIELDRAFQCRCTCQWPLSPHGEVLAGTDLVFFLACHASLGLANLSLLRLTELILVIRTLEDEQRLSWSELLDLAMLSGSPASAYPALRLANMLAPHSVPKGVLDALDREAPSAVRRVLAPLTPATVQRILRCSITERFMWTRSLSGWVREIWESVFPAGSWRQVYRYRISVLLGGTLTR